MKYSMNLLEILFFLNLLPKASNVATLRIVQKVMKDVGITDEEFKKYKIVQDGNTFNFDPKKGKEKKTFEIGEIAAQLIVTELKRLDQESKVTQDQLSLYDLFVK